MLRVGLGTDKHRLGPGRPLILGGVRIESPKGAIGHSDADALAHAVIDALLGACGLGDIGMRFPDSDPQWKGADSIGLLKTAIEMVRAAGYRPVNLDSVIHLEHPKLGPYKQEMAQKLAETLGLPAAMVNVKAKSGEACGEVGRGEAVEAFASVLVESAAL